jgi:3-hydroxyisobutyrate dehydrogenase-like beta-hydroxyacid dehydrogenase
MARIGFLGLGAMGGRMAAALLRAGHELRVWNRTAGRDDALVALGAVRAATPRDAVARAEFAISMVRDDASARAVWLAPDVGAVAGLAPGSVALECSTVTPAWIDALATACRRAGAEFLDAPVAGSRPQAEAGQLIFLVGGGAAVLARAEPVLKAMGGAVHHAGPTGSGATIKLAVNALLGVQIAAMAELVGWLARCPLKLADAVRIIGATPVVSPAARVAAETMLAGNFAPLFPVELVAKDLGYLAAAATAQGAATPVADAAGSVFERALREGLGEAHATAVARLYR